MNWPNLRMPEGIELDDSTYTNTYGKFTVQPLERGFGVTIGNALRRVLLSSLPGAAITSVRFENVLHEFSTIPGVVEDVAEIILNLKQVRIKLINKRPDKVTLDLQGPMEFKAGDIMDGTTDFEILNPDFHIATLWRPFSISLLADRCQLQPSTNGPGSAPRACRLGRFAHSKPQP